jgi:hypothetical protein
MPWSLVRSQVGPPKFDIDATVVELVYTRDLKSRAAGIEGSSPSSRTS